MILGWLEVVNLGCVTHVTYVGYLNKLSLVSKPLTPKSMNKKTEFAKT